MGKESSSEGALVKVTLQELKGIRVKAPVAQLPSPFVSLCQGEVHTSPVPRIPHVTAAVAFSGSAQDMQVGSNFICSKTGNVVVESQTATLAPTFQIDEHDRHSDIPLVAEWSECDASIVTNPQGSPHSVSSSASFNPHLTISLPSRDPRLPATPISQLNRDCNVVHEDQQLPSLDESDGSSAATDLAEQLDHQEKTDILVWSKSNVAMPEIIELNVSLILRGDYRESDSHSKFGSHETTLVGIAYLCLFGNDVGMTIMDLPIKKHPSQVQSPTYGATHPVVSLEEEASLRICVNVLPGGSDDSNVPVVSTEDLYSKSLLGNSANDLDPILQQLHLAHQNHRTLRRKSAEMRANEQQGIHDMPPPSPGMSCGFGLMEVLQSLSDAMVKQCDGEGTLGLYRTDSMASTIMTAESLDI